MRADGVAFVPEDALGMAAVGQPDVLENMALGDTRALRAARAGWRWTGTPCARISTRALDRLGVTVPSPDAPLGTLSGGNVQRVVLARELARDPRLIVAFYPTRGLDVRSASGRARAPAAPRATRAPACCSSPRTSTSCFALSDRLVVLFRGRVVGEGRAGRAHASRRSAT